MEDLQFVPVRVKGQFDYEHEIYLGPKTDTVEYPKNGGMFQSHPTPGVQVITPFRLADRE